jgi:hypothetical protein
MPIVYILTNPVMPGLVKIGCTDRPIEERLRELASASGVPVPFECFLAVEVASSREIEAALHQAFADRRVNQKREFFTLSLDRPAAILQLFRKEPGADVTPESDVAETEEEREALNQERVRRSNFNFSMVGLVPGAQLVSAFDEALTCTVIDERRVNFEGHIMSLSAAAKEAAHKTGRHWKAVQGPLFWLHHGKSLDALRDEYEAST